MNDNMFYLALCGLGVIISCFILSFIIVGVAFFGG